MYLMLPKFLSANCIYKDEFNAYSMTVTALTTGDVN